MASSGCRWLVAALSMAALLVVAVIAVSLQAQSDRPAGAPAVVAPVANRFTLTTAPLGEKRTGMFLVDAQTMRVLVYGLDGDKGALKLLAVRDISQDVRLSQYNNLQPLPEEIRQMVEAGPGGAAAK